jgi:hypothetical protein
MENRTNFTLNSISILSGQQEIEVYGSMNKGLLSYETKLNVSSTDLNRILNQLIAINEMDEAFFELFENYIGSAGESFMKFDACQLRERELDLSVLGQLNQPMQIRA